MALPALDGPGHHANAPLLLANDASVADAVMQGALFLVGPGNA